MKRCINFTLSLAAVLAAGGTTLGIRSVSAWQVPPVGPSGPVTNLPVTGDLPVDVRVRNLSVNILNQAGAAQQSKSDAAAAQTRLDEQKRKLNQLKSEPPPPGSGETARREHQNRIAEAQREVDRRQQEYSDKYAAAAREQEQFKKTQSDLGRLQKDPAAPQIDPQELWKLYVDKVPAAGKQMPADFKDWVGIVVNWDLVGELPIKALRPGPGRPGDPLPLTKPSDLAAWEALEAGHRRCVDLQDRMTVLLEQVKTKHAALERAEQQLTDKQTALNDKENEFNELTPPPINYALYDRCPEGNPWSQCDHEEIKQQWLREQRADYYRDKDRLRAEYAEKSRDFEAARAQLERDIADYLQTQSELQTASDAFEKEAALFQELLQKYQKSQ